MRPLKALLALRLPGAAGLWPGVPIGGTVDRFATTVHTGLPVVLGRPGELEAAVCSGLAVVLGQFEALDDELRTCLPRYDRSAHANVGVLGDSSRSAFIRVPNPFPARFLQTGAQLIANAWS